MAERPSPARTVLLAAAMLAGPAIAADPAIETFVTREGERIATPAPGAMTCESLFEKLMEIDALGIRSGPRPEHEEDWPLFQYEIAIAQRYYTDCVKIEAEG